MALQWKHLLVVVALYSEAFASPCINCASEKECSQCLNAVHAHQEAERITRERFRSVEVRVTPRTSSVIITEPFDIDFVVTNQGDQIVWFNWDESCQVGSWELEGPHVSETASGCAYGQLKRIELSHGESFAGKYNAGLKVNGPAGSRVKFKAGFRPTPIIEPQWSNEIELHILPCASNQSPSVSASMAKDFYRRLAAIGNTSLAPMYTNDAISISCFSSNASAIALDWGYKEESKRDLSSDAGGEFKCYRRAMAELLKDIEDIPKFRIAPKVVESAQEALQRELSGLTLDRKGDSTIIRTPAISSSFTLSNGIKMSCDYSRELKVSVTATRDLKASEDTLFLKHCSSKSPAENNSIDSR